MRKARNRMKKGMRTSVLTASLLLCGSVAVAQSRKSGVVTDAKGEPLIGVTVMEQGTNNGTVTDVNGRYTLTTTSKDARLKVSYVGYADQIITPGESVVLMEDDKMLNEVVVVGYGTMRRKDVTSSITTIKSEDLNKGVFNDVGSMLQGKVAGLVVSSNGDPNGAPSITLRGASSLRSGAAMQPYYVIDGIPGVDISMVAPDDIESIDVLRDATATAIYGSKAANGVIIITTKSGKSGAERTSVTYGGYVAFDNILKTLDMATAQDIRDYVTANNIRYEYDGGASTDWQDQVLRTGISHNHNVAINGSSKKTSYMASVNYQNREGVIIGSDMHRLNLRSLLTTKVLKDHLSISAGINTMYGRHVGVKMDNEGASVLDAMNYYNPTNPVYNENGGWYAATGSQNYNPHSLIHENTSSSMWKRNQFIAKASLDIIDGLVWNANYSYDNYQSTFNGYDSHQTQLDGVRAYNGRASRNTYFGSSQNFETFGNYDRTFNKLHKVALMAGYSWEERVSNDGFGLTVHNFFDDTLKWNNLTYAGAIDGMPAVNSGTKETVRNISFYGRVSYSYAGRYMFQATVRRDGSSVFGKDHRWGTFPSVSVAWNITEEDFMKDQKVLSNLKLRLGYGVSGNALGFGAYSAVATYGASGSYFNDNGNPYVSLGATKLPNPDLKWESTGMLNAGLDFAFLGGRINGSVEVYNKKTKDLIWDYPVSTFIYPFGNIAANVGEITNTGVEFSLNAVPVKMKDFEWNTTLTLSHNKNVVNRLSNEKYHTDIFDQGDPGVAGVSAQGFTQRVLEGEPIGTFYLYEFAGFNSKGQAQFVERDAKGHVTGNYTTNPEYKDRTVVGNAQPKLNLGWNNTFNYKNWSMTMFFTGVFGHKIYNGTRAHYNAPDLFSGGKNVLKEFITDRPKTDTYSNVPSTRWLEKGDYFRLQSLTLGYTFTRFDNWIRSLQVYATANNVFTLTGYTSVDPEVNLGGIAPGVEYRWNNYPHTRTFMLGVKVNF